MVTDGTALQFEESSDILEGGGAVSETVEGWE